MLYKANYTSCWGGYKEDYYVCELCERVTDAYGEEPDWNVAYWICNICGMPFKDFEGNFLVADLASVILPRFNNRRIDGK